MDNHEDLPQRKQSEQLQTKMINEVISLTEWNGLCAPRKYCAYIQATSSPNHSGLRSKTGLRLLHLRGVARRARYFSTTDRYQKQLGSFRFEDEDEYEFCPPEV